MQNQTAEGPASLVQANGSGACEIWCRTKRKGQPWKDCLQLLGTQETFQRGPIGSISAASSQHAKEEHGTMEPSTKPWALLDVWGYITSPELCFKVQMQHKICWDLRTFSLLNDLASVKPAWARDLDDSLGGSVHHHSSILCHNHYIHLISCHMSRKFRDLQK